MLGLEPRGRRFESYRPDHLTFPADSPILPGWNGVGPLLILPEREPMITPARNLILVALEKPADVSEGGIHLPDAAQTRLPRGKVIDVGPDYASHETPYPLGSIVYFSPYAGFDIAVEGVDHLILNPDDIVASERKD